MAIKLYYFGLPGRAEVARLCLHIAGTDFEDLRFSFEDWSKFKAKMPFGQAPVLEVDRKLLAQSAAIDRYLAAKAGLVPEDLWQAALADQAYCYCHDLMQPLYDTFKIKELDEKIAARKAVLDGPLKDKLAHATKLVEAAADGYVAGPTLSHGDLHLFSTLSTLTSGWLDGVPKDLLDSYPVLKAYRNKIASHPKVKAYYEKAENDDDVRRAYKPDA
ncbi:glutathione S-transferase [Raphidocelis subcapitata]|uniref:Glutathione S-transferase n=1 Tax=Raphidocelis subcapitata TaxID=307507 RepID=A0A2V0PLZ4_9CHLO|nr:glutathione S-transferase [Raphidocelis subcapitata]|eukprot:GBF98377.1 glutathione S-transferase [Raphidocelis subcapitata]